ncbi:MAG: hypothetical protein HY000_05090 [Planctomycetes bacterium]|nr:hypothetical protein [Planctomycetota bacterium]
MTVTLLSGYPARLDATSERPCQSSLSTDTSLFLIYIISQADPNWEMRQGLEAGFPIAIVEFLVPHAHMFGPPNDEASEGHPLASRGLTPYAACEVKHSSWIRQLERMNAVHPCHQPESFSSYRHFVFAFHDSTFECVAEGFEVSVFHGFIHDAVRKVVDALDA